MNGWTRLVVAGYVAGCWLARKSFFVARKKGEKMVDRSLKSFRDKNGITTKRPTSDNERFLLFTPYLFCETQATFKSY